jgi:hypothetical protein
MPAIMDAKPNKPISGSSEPVAGRELPLLDELADVFWPAAAAFWSDDCPAADWLEVVVWSGWLLGAEELAAVWSLGALVVLAELEPVAGCAYAGVLACDPLPEAEGVLAVAEELVLLLLWLCALEVDWSAGAGGCSPTEAFVFGAFGSVVAAPLFDAEDEELCVEFIVLEVEGEEAALEVCAPLLFISLEFAELEEGVVAAVLDDPALLADVSVLVAPEVAPAPAAAPMLLADGPELLLPAPQWSDTMVTLLTWKALAAPLPEVVLLGEAVEPLAVLGLLAAELLLFAFVPEAPEAVLGWPVICTWCPTWAARLSVFPLNE